MLKEKKYWLGVLGLTLLFTLLLLTLSWVHNLYPLGSKLWIRADSYTQYSIFYKFFREQLLSGHSLLYSFQIGMGGSLFSILAYYLMSPLSILIIFFKNNQIILFITLLIFLKIILAGITFFTYLYSQKKQNFVVNATFSMLYAFMSFNIIYAYNVMWLDSIVLLPLSFLTIDHLFKTKKFLPMVVVLTILFISNFYMAYIAGLGILLYFLYKLLLLKGHEWFSLTVRFLLSVTLSFLLSAWLIIPTYIGLKSGPKIPLSLHPFERKMGIWSAISSQFSNNNHLFDGADIYGGSLIILLSLVFILLPNVAKRIRLYFVLVMVFFAYSYTFQLPYLFWHAFQQPTGFGYRFSFLITTTLLLAAYGAINNLQKSNKNIIIFATIIESAVLVILILKNQLMIQQAGINLILILIFGLLLLEQIGWHEKYLQWSVCIFLLAAVDTFQNANFILHQYESTPGYESSIVSWENNQTEGLTDAISVINKDKTFFRTVVLPNNLLNQGMLNNYNGFSWFNTFGYQDMAFLLNHLGYSTSLGNKSLAYQNGNTIADSVLGLKYKVVPKNDTLTAVNYHRIYSNKQYDVYENNAVFPIAWVNNSFNDSEQLSGDTFGNQLRLLTNNSNVLKRIDPISSSTKHIRAETVNNSYVLTPLNNQAHVTYNFKLPANSELYTRFVSMNGAESYGKLDFKVGNRIIQGYPNYHHDGNLSLLRTGNLEQEVSVSLNVHGVVQMAENPTFYLVSGNELRRSIKHAQVASLKVENSHENQISGRIYNKKTTKLLFSVPYDPCWNCFVNEKKVTISNNHGLIQLRVNHGMSNIKLIYLPKGLKVGAGISAITLMLIIIMALVIKYQGKLHSHLSRGKHSILVSSK